MERKPNIFWIIGATALVVILMVIGMGRKGAAAGSPQRDRPPKIEVEQELQNRLMAGDDDFGYLIYFKNQPDLSPAFELDWEARGRYVVDALQVSADTAQKGVRDYLDAQGVVYQSYWVDNVIVVQRGSNSATFNSLMRFPEIAALRARRQPMLHDPVATSVLEAEIQAVGTNLTHIGVDQVWAMGYTSEGITVANIDTGVRYTHEALVNQYRGNLGGSFNHNYNWWDPSPGGSDLVPNDFHNHGSHTMGVILGDDGNDDQIGMAPGATWIACQAFEDDDQELLECGQFMLAPWDLNGENPDPDLRPHIINNSWGDCLTTMDPWYKGVIASWHAAGIYPVFSNGNASNCYYPAPAGLNTVGNPARYGDVTGVGSTTRDTGLYASHSNWGPTDDLDTINPLGYPNLKPQVVAPGVSIRSAARYADDYYIAMSGTSMSAPHVTGLIALMWEAAPCLIGDYATTETILQETANPVPYPTNNGDEGPGNVPNHATGWGEIDAPAAVLAALTICPIYTTPRSQQVCLPGDRVFMVNANETLTYPVSLSVSGLPGGVTADFNPNTIHPPGTSILTASITNTATAGNYPLDVIGISKSIPYSDTVVLGIRSGVPNQPTLLSPLDNAVDVLERLELTWDTVPLADSYYLEISLNHGFSSVVYSTTLATSSHTVGNWLAYNTTFFWRVRADNVCGLGDESEIFEFQTRAAPPILLVDDDDNVPDMRSTYTSTLETLGFPYAIWDTQPMGLEPDSAFLTDYDVVIWFTGDNYMAYTGPGSDGEAALGNWLDTGKCLLISSQDYEYVRGVTSFMTSYLGVTSVTDYIQQTMVTGAGPVFENLGSFSLQYPFNNFSDSMTPSPGTDTAFYGDTTVAGVSLDNGTFKTSFWGFPFEALPTQGDRDSAMSEFLKWCLDLNFHYYFPIIGR